MMPDRIHQSEFAARLISKNIPLDDSSWRLLVFKYCKQYQEIYGFEQLTSVYSYLEMILTSTNEEQHALEGELPEIRAEVELAMGEYFESLNEIATALYRLLNPRGMTIDERLEVINHVWRAHACNESPKDFISREDEFLCSLLDEQTT